MRKMHRMVRQNIDLGYSGRKKIKKNSSYFAKCTITTTQKSGERREPISVFINVVKVFIFRGLYEIRTYYAPCVKLRGVRCVGLAYVIVETALDDLQLNSAQV